MSSIWLHPVKLYRLHRVCWSAYKRCWRGGLSPVSMNLNGINIVQKDWMPKDQFMLVTDKQAILAETKDFYGKGEIEEIQRRSLAESEQNLLKALEEA